MTDINSLVTNNFNDNISYIQSNQPELFSKLSALDSAIELGHYIEKYELVYENSYFDVLEKDTNNYLYGKDSTTHASLAKDSIDYNLNDNLFEGFHKHEISQDDVTLYKNKEPFEHHMSGFAPIMHYSSENSPKEKTLKTIDKFIFFGAGLGLHVSSIHEKVKAKVYFIVEDDLELFRLSLFTTNYKYIASDTTLVFSIFENSDEFSKSAENFLKTEYYYNHYLKYFHLLSHGEDKINQFHVSLTSLPHLVFFYHHLLTKNLKPLDYLYNQYNFLHKTLDLSDKTLQNKPFLLIAAGPSLEKNKLWLKDNHKKFIIVALSATLSFLEKEDIKPDIITHLDAFDFAKKHFDRIYSLDFFKDSICFFSSKIPQDVVTLFKKEQLFFFENGTQYKNLSIKPSAPCVGSLTYQLLLRLNAKSMYLLGLDLAIDKKTGKTHSDSHGNSQTIDINKNDNDSGYIHFKRALVKIEGNLNKIALTTPIFKTSVSTINLSTQLLKKDTQTIYNLSNGAKFTDTIAKITHDVDTSKFSSDDIKSHLYKLCLNNSSSGLNEIETKNLYNKLQHAKQMMNIVNTYSKLSSISASEYIHSLKELCISLTISVYIKNYELSRVLDTYLQYLIPYIFDFFNDIELKNEKKHINNLDNLLVSHLFKIIDFYYNTLESKLKTTNEIT